MNLKGCVGLEVRKKPERTLRSLTYGVQILYHSETTSLLHRGTGLHKIRDEVNPRRNVSVHKTMRWTQGEKHLFLRSRVG